MNLTGLAESFVKNISVIAKENNPQYKVTPVGFLQMLLENPVTYEISNLKQIRDGHEHSLKFRYMQRGLESDVTDRDDCLTPLSPLWKETTITRPFFSKIGISIPDSVIRSWDSEASQKLGIGSPTAQIMTGLYETALVKINGLLQKIDANLLSAQTAAWGVNAETGLNTARTVNFANIPVMNDGIVRLLQDYQSNEMNGTPLIVGNGIVSSYNLLQSLKISTDTGGFGSNPTFKMYNDPRSTGIWGANHFGVFAPGFTGFVDFNKYVGGFSNDTGSSVKFLLPVPVLLANGELSSLVFDAQLKNEPCNIYDEENELIVKEGWALILSKSYGLFNSPNDLFATGDRLAGVNGAFHYLGTAV